MSSSVDYHRRNWHLALLQVVGLHRAGPSATLDKVMKLQSILRIMTHFVKKKSVPDSGTEKSLLFQEKSAQ